MGSSMTRGRVLSFRAQATVAGASRNPALLSPGCHNVILVFRYSLIFHELRAICRLNTFTGLNRQGSAPVGRLPSGIT